MCLLRPDWCHSPPQPHPHPRHTVLQPEAPSYSQMESVLRALPWSQSSKPLLERVNAEMQFLRNSLDTPPQRQQDQQ